MRGILLIGIALILATNLNAQETGTFTDPRDGEKYNTITIEDPLVGTKVTWMAQNLRYRTADSWAYDNDEKYVNNLGRLYTWEAAKKACPPGWSLPTDTDWRTLVNEFGGQNSAGRELKSTRGWHNNGNGTNSSGFSVLPAGFYNTKSGVFGFIGENTYFWSATEDARDVNFAIVWSFHDSNRAWRWTEERGSWGRKTEGRSVRCLRD